MKLNTNNNIYTILYTTILVVIVAGVLAYASTALKPKQQENIALEKMQSLLRTARLGEDASAQDNKSEYIKALYSKHMTNDFVLNYEGKVIEGEAFETDLQAQYNIIKQIVAAKTPEAAQALRERLRLPVFVCTIDDKVLNIFPCYGPGLWGPIWGYIAVEDDFETIYGAVFDHKGETPGLGAEIAHATFYNQFVGKKLSKDGVFKSISIVKGGAQADNPNGVDAISGGTITSQSLENAIAIWLNEYQAYFNIKRAAIGSDECCDEEPCTGDDCDSHDETRNQEGHEDHTK
ncbi:MAG TPA: NADH:ubiquinone reductase (Na(+)-transporting) subunit C [Bacteroidales bacterium]|nr:NADH:ubiquinone reductase (Na(+)-transporting) subunit C [Bacteroidales bacterium]HPK30029.1 NADH:ubiquinone reductase (Na(+)-transporting) subunit C [Bacteroidales bacterium]